MNDRRLINLLWNANHDDVIDYVEKEYISKQKVKDIIDRIHYKDGDGYKRIRVDIFLNELGL